MKNKKGTKSGALLLSIWRAGEEETGHWESIIAIY